MGLLGFWRHSHHERVGFQLYGAAVTAARDPVLYAELGVPDTLDGRFDLIGLYVFLLIRRLRGDGPPGPALAQAVFDAMFSDMDVNLREMGVGDLSVGKRVRAMWEAFHGRAAAYEQAMTTGGAAGGAALAESLARNVWRGASPAASRGAGALARLALAQDAALARATLADLAAGRVDLLPAATRLA